MSTPNPFHLPPKERARCDHIERKMAPSGRYSVCGECMIEGLARSLKPVEHYGDRPHVRLVFNESMTTKDAAALQLGLAHSGLIDVRVSMEEGGKAIRMYADGDEEHRLNEAAEWLVNYRPTQQGEA